MRQLWRQLLFRLRNQRFEQDLAEEMRLHLELRAEENRARGHAPEDASAAARRKLGNLTLQREISREAWGWTWLDSLRQDIRYGIRSLSASPGFTATAVLSLALGIGANTAIFSILNAVLLRNLPIDQPEQLVNIHSGGDNEYTYPIWQQLRDHQTTFSGMLAYAPARFDLSDGGESHFTQGLWVSGDFFKVLGVPANMGRTLTNDDDRPGHAAVAIISYAFWKRHFGGQGNALGQSIRLDRQRFEIVGITPSWFTGLDSDQSFDIAIPINAEPLIHASRSLLNSNQFWWLRILGRVAPGTTLEQARSGLSTLAPHVFAATLDPSMGPEERAGYLKNSMLLKPVSTGFSETGARYRTALYALMAIVGAVLLIACANIANLLLARGASRQGEFSIRMAIGASRLRVVRQLMTESLLLSALGAACGLLLALWGGRLLVHLLSTTRRPVVIDISPDPRLLLFTLAVALATAFLFGLAPALRTTRVPVNQTIKGASRMSLGKALVAGQIALSLALLIAAGLFLGTIRNLMRVDTGFTKRNVMLVNVDLMQAAVPESQRTHVFRQILERLRNVPGVVAAAASVITPVEGNGMNGFVVPDGQRKPAKDGLVLFNGISPSYFQTMQTPVLVGRDFNDHDDAVSGKKIIINQQMARQFFGDADPVGKAVRLGREPDLYQIVGVVANTTYGRLNEEPQSIAYLPIMQSPPHEPSLQYEVRSFGPAGALTADIQKAIAAESPRASLQFRALESQVNDSLAQQTVVAILSSSFGAVALLLAMVGLYGITAYSVARRRAEIGIRLALGATRASLIWLVLRGVGALLVVGISIGIGIALASGRLVSSLLFGVRPTDPAQLIGAALLLAAATAIAAYLPARRAARLNPMSALREQ